MLYLINTIKIKGGENIYNMFETHTESRLKGSSNYVLKLINSCNMEPINIDIEETEISGKAWVQEITDLSNRNKICILLAKISDQSFKTLNFNNEIVCMSEKDLKYNIDSKKVLNCLFEQGEYKSIYTYNITTNIKFKQYIAEKYREFRAKTLMLGIDSKFIYSIENEDVKILDYAGTSKKVVIPNFVTTICSNAFRNQNIQEIKLNRGLKRIGKTAFANNKIDYIEIPETVEFVGPQAFDRDAGRVTMNRNHSPIIKQLNDKTVLL